MRLSKVSVSNCKVADKFQLVHLDGFPDKFAIIASNQGRTAYLHSGNGDFMLYDSIHYAIKAIKRINSKAEITTI